MAGTAAAARAASTRRRVQDVAPERLAQLHAGQPTTHLTESLALDFATLLRTSLPQADACIAQALARSAGDGISRRMAQAGALLLQHGGAGVIAQLAQHPSDTVRGWACYAIAAQAGQPLDARLRAMRPLADDAHFGVREWAWLALRSHVAADLPGALELLAAWTHDASPRIRRFASEATRPRGVWCAHLAPLKRSPALGLPVLAPLRADPDAYVQDSVANWLNDAAKDQPAWVRTLCAQWLAELGPSTAPAHAQATQRICHRAQRSLR